MRRAEASVPSFIGMAQRFLSKSSRPRTKQAPGPSRATIVPPYGATGTLEDRQCRAARKDAVPLARSAHRESGKVAYSSSIAPGRDADRPRAFRFFFRARQSGLQRCGRFCWPQGPSGAKRSNAAFTCLSRERVTREPVQAVLCHYAKAHPYMKELFRSIPRSPYGISVRARQLL